MSRRLVSHTEISVAYDCQFKHALSYTGHLTNDRVLKSRAPHARLRAGRAWGRGVAAFHQCDPEKQDLIVRYSIGLAAVNTSLDQDANAMQEHGFYDQAEHHDMAVRIADILWHYAETAEPLKISDPEFKLELPIPSRTGRGVSNRYGFHGFLDGLVVEDGRLWIGEYKMRDQLSDFETVANSQQVREYVWAAERVMGVRLAGAIVDERLSIAPKPAKWVWGKRKGEGMPPFNDRGIGRVPSHTADQLTTAALYVEACLEAGVDINQATVDALNERRWQRRHKVLLTRREIDEAGRDLVSSAHYIGLLDSGVIRPVRNRSPRLCGGCQFKSICNDPSDMEVIGTNFDLRDPKRLRTEPLEAAAA